MSLDGTIVVVVGENTVVVVVVSTLVGVVVVHVVPLLRV